VKKMTAEAQTGLPDGADEALQEAVEEEQTGNQQPRTNDGDQNLQGSDVPLSR
jgi:hypothetical protein